jgi:hypothetical protein
MSLSDELEDGREVEEDDDDDDEGSWSGVGTLETRRTFPSTTS